MQSGPGIGHEIPISAAETQVKGVLGANCGLLLVGGKIF